MCIRDSVDTESAALETASAALSAQEEQHASLESSFADFKSAYDAQSTAVSEQESLLQSLLTGMASGQHETQGGFQGQLAKAREKATAAKSEVQQAQVQIDHIERELRVKEPQAKHEAQESRALYKKLASVQQAAQEAEQAMHAYAFDEKRYEQLRAERLSLEQDMQRLASEREAMQDRLPSALQFTYVDPTLSLIHI